MIAGDAHFDGKLDGIGLQLVNDDECARDFLESADCSGPSQVGRRLPCRSAG